MSAFKKILACVAALLPCTAAIAANMDGVYIGQQDGTPVIIELRGEGQVQGVLRSGNIEAPLTAREANGKMQGLFRAADGREVPFVGSSDGTLLQMTAANQTVVLQRRVAAPAVDQRPGVDAPAGQRPQPGQEMPAAPAAQAAPRLRGVPVQGEIFACAIPQGWQHIETTNEVKVFSPDGSIVYGFSGVESSNQPNPMAYMIQSMQGGKWQNIKVVDTRKVDAPRGQSIFEVLYTFSFNGTPFRGWARVATLYGVGANNYYMLYSTAVPKLYDQFAEDIKALASSITVTNQNLVFQRQHRAGVLANQNLNRPMDHDLVTGGYWKQQAANEAIAARRSDVNRGSYGVTNTTTGERGHVGPGAIGVGGTGLTDPNGQQWQLDPHWQQQQR